MTLQTISTSRSYCGWQGIFMRSSAASATDMTFSVLVPLHEVGAKLPAVWYLSGLTCTHANVTDKREYRAACAELGLFLAAPDTTPRGDEVPDDPVSAYDAGLNLTLRLQPGYDHNYRFIAPFFDDHLRWHAKKLMP